MAGLATVPVRAGQATWILYLATPDVVYSVQVLRARGERLLYGPARVMMVIGVDPVDAMIGLCQPRTPAEVGQNRPGIAALGAARHMGWPGRRRVLCRALRLPTTPNRRWRRCRLHHLVSASTSDAGPLTHAPDCADPDQGAQWLPHFAVDPRMGTDAATEQVLALGGRVDIEPYDTDFGRIARVTDPSGAAFAVIDPTDRVYPTSDVAAGTARVDDPYDDWPHPGHATCTSSVQRLPHPAFGLPSMTSRKLRRPCLGTNPVQTTSPNNT